MNTRKCVDKLERSVRLARETRRASWQCAQSDRKAYLRVSAEALQDARYWAQLVSEGAP